MKRTKEDAEQTRQLLMQSALRVFSEKGYAATRLEDIADAAQLTRGAIYHHFGNKKNLFISLFKDRIDPVFDIMTQVLAENINPLERVRKLLLVMFDKIVDDRDFNASQRLEMFETKMKKEMSELREYMASRGRNLVQLLVQLISTGMQSGDIRKDVDPTAIAFSIISFIAGFGMVMTNQEDLYDVAAKRKEMIDVIIQGIRAQ